MGRDKLYPLLATGLVFLAVLVFLFVPEKHQESRSGRLFQRDWRKIVYQPTTGAEIVLLKEGLVQPEYYVMEKERRYRANSSVSNIFRDWKSPEVRGVLSEPQEKLSEYGITENAATISLYESSTAEEPSLIVIAGNKSRSNGKFARVQKGAFDNDLFILSHVLFSRFRPSAVDYRDRRIMEYGPDEHLESIDIRFWKGGEEKHIALEKDHIQKEGKEKEVWVTVSGDEQIELEARFGRTLKGAVDRIRIDAFFDETDALEPDTGADKHTVEMVQQMVKGFKAGKSPAPVLSNEATAVHYTSRLDSGETISVAILQPDNQILAHGREVYVMHTSRDPFENYVYASSVGSLIRSATGVIEHIQSQKDRQSQQQKKTNDSMSEGGMLESPIPNASDLAQ